MRHMSARWEAAGELMATAVLTRLHAVAATEAGQCVQAEVATHKLGFGGEGREHGVRVGGVGAT